MFVVVCRVKGVLGWVERLVGGQAFRRVEREEGLPVYEFGGGEE